MVCWLLQRLPLLLLGGGREGDNVCGRVHVDSCYISVTNDKVKLEELLGFYIFHNMGKCNGTFA